VRPRSSTPSSAEAERTGWCPGVTLDCHVLSVAHSQAVRERSEEERMSDATSGSDRYVIITCLVGPKQKH
jgi:hypothetical protein